MTELTSERLRELLNYNPETGVFTWRQDRGPGRPSAGDRAGYLADRGYMKLGLDGEVYRCHRLAWLYMTGEWPSAEIDHINRVKTDNRWANLRLADRHQNLANVQKAPRGKCPKGVYPHSTGRFRAILTWKGQRHHLGTYETVEEAEAAYLSKSEELHGDYRAA